MVVPYGDPSERAGLEERVRRGRVGARSHDPAAHARLRLRRRRSTTSTRRSPTSRAKPWVIENAICIHEEDYGILWKHVDLLGGRERGAAQPSPRRQLRLDRRQLRVRLLLVLLPRRQHPARGEAHGHRLADGDRAGHASRSSRTSSAEGVAAPHHQHLFNARLDFDVDGSVNDVHEVEAERVPPGPRQPVGQRVPAEVDPSRYARPTARRDMDAATSRAWHISNPDVRNAHGRPVAYRLVPTMSTPTMLAHARFVGRAARRLRAAQPLGDALRARRAASRGRVPEPARGRRRPSRVDRGGPFDRRHRHRLLVHVRRDALRAAGGLAGHAGRVLRLPPEPVGFFDHNPTLDVPRTTASTVTQTGGE